MELINDASVSHPETWSESADALEGYLEPGEQIRVSVSALVRVGFQFFDRCELVLTDRQLIVLKPSWPWGFRYEQGMLRSECLVSKYKERVDGSQLLVVSTDDGDVCFFVPRRSKDGGVAILEALR